MTSAQAPVRERKVARCERGDILLEFAPIVTVMAILISAALSMGPYIHFTFSTNQAAHDCAIAASQSLNQQQGAMQGRVAMQLAYATFRLPAVYASNRVAGNWDRNGTVECRVTFHVPLENFPMRMIVPMPSEYSVTVYYPVQTWKSRWTRP
jgi:Flp pilus assembly protein TadG